MTDRIKQSLPYARGEHLDTMSDAERKEEFAETGNPTYLTPALARSMGVPPELMRQVPGATDEDIAYAQWHEREIEAIHKQRLQGMLAPFGADDKSLAQLSSETERIRRLLDVATLRQEHSSDHALEEVKDYILDVLQQDVLEREGVIYTLFDALRHDDAQGLKDIEVLERIYEFAHSLFVTLSHTVSSKLSERDKHDGHNAARALNEFVAVARGVLSGEGFLPDTRYLFAEKLTALAMRIGITEEVNKSLDNVVPFEITDGVYATFTHDGDRLYIADGELAHTIEAMLARTQVPARIEQGHYFARHVRVMVPDDIYDIRDLILDAGSPLDTLLHTMGIDDADAVHDYLSTINDVSVRSVIEDDFNVSLHELSIREQFFFLDFLKQVTVSEAKAVQHFAEVYGLLGMRAFLATEQLGREYGDTIIAFGNHMHEYGEEHSAEMIFSAFGKLHMAAESAEQVILRFVDRADPRIVHNTAQSIRKKAAQLLADALAQPLGSSHESWDHVNDAIRRMKVDTVFFTSVFQSLYEQGGVPFEEIKDISLETHRGGEMPPELVAQLEEMMRRDYADINAQLRQHPDDPDFYSQAFIELIVDTMKQRTTDDTSRFYVFKRNDTPVGALRIDTTRDEAGTPIYKYLGSFMVGREFGGGKIGQAIFREALKQEKKDGVPVYLDCDARPRVPTTQMYLREGFVALFTHDYGGVPAFRMVYDAALNSALTTRSLSRDEVVARAANNESHDTVRYVKCVGRPDFSMLHPNGAWVMTQYFRGDDGAYYTVFERNPMPERTTTQPA